MVCGRCAPCVLLGQRCPGCGLQAVGVGGPAVGCGCWVAGSGGGLWALGGWVVGWLGLGGGLLGSCRACGWLGFAGGIKFELKSEFYF